MSPQKKMQDMTADEFMGLLKDLQVKHLEPEIRRIVKEELRSERSSFWVPAERHYQEHAHLEKCVKSVDERESNHEFISTVRTGVGYAGKITFGLAISALVIFFGGAIWLALKNAVAAKGV